MRSRDASFLIVLALSGVLARGQSNPVPFVSQPLVPDTVAPGQKGFDLTVNGAGFSSSAVVEWNGSTRITQFISVHQLVATINAKDVAEPGTASVTVMNPAPGGGSSNVVPFPVRKKSASVVLSPASNFSNASANAVGDFNNDGKLDVAVGIASSNSGGEIDIYLGNGDGTFSKPVKTTTVTPILSLLAADFDGDGRLDLAYTDNTGNTTVFLGDGKGGMTQQQVFHSSAAALAAADLNGDGKLDLVAVGAYQNIPIYVYLGNGDGTFKSLEQIGASGEYAPSVALGDFNRDGYLDLAVIIGSGEYFVDVLLSNGDGTFQTPVAYQLAYGGTSIVAADVNGDGILDLVTNGVSVLLGQGDGTFNKDGGVNLKIANGVGMSIGDLNGDGHLDLAVGVQQGGSNGIDILLGKGNGSFSAPLNFAVTANPTNVSVGDFNRDGRLDVVGGNLLLQIPVSLTPSSIDFGVENVGTKSSPQTAALTNEGSSNLNITGIGINGNDPQDFSQTNHCPSGLPPGKSCKIQVTFTPTTTGSRNASLYVKYEGIGSPQTVALSGTGANLTVTLTPSNMTFVTQLINTTSNPQIATLTNTGTEDVTISKISTSDPFKQSNDCSSDLPPNSFCEIQMTFTPNTKGRAAGTLYVYDNAAGSPQAVKLSGTGTVVKLSASSINFGDQKVGTKSSAVPIELTNEGSTFLSISQVVISGTNSSNFTQTNNCGKGVRAGGSCTIKIRFEPTATGHRSADLEIHDDGGGSPQQVGLTGTGT
jgi:hypothetical protein